MNAQAALLERITNEASANAVEYDIVLSFRNLRAVADTMETFDQSVMTAAEASLEAEMRTATERLGRAHGRASIAPGAAPIIMRAMADANPPM